MSNCPVIVVVVGLLSAWNPLFAQHGSASPLEGGSPTDHWTAGWTCDDSDFEVDSPIDIRLVGPLRPNDCGISLEPVYYGEMFTNTRGGISTNDATRYQGLLDLPLTLDLDKMQLPLPGKFFLLAQNTHGRGLAEEFIGDSQVVSNIDSLDNIMQVSEYWWEIGLSDNVAIRLGKQDVNTEFLTMDLAADFIQSSFGLSPISTSPTYPNPSMAGLLLVNLKEELSLKVGIWDALADGGSWGFSGNEVVSLFGAIDYTYALGDGRFPGAWEIGAAYISGGDVSGTSLPTGHGYYVQLEQFIYRENVCDEADTQGLGIFVSYFPRFSSGAIPVSAIGDDFVAGIVYRGLIPCRDEDVLGAGVAWAELFLGGTNEETVVEFFYKARITPYLHLQPDLQYIASPSGIHRDALAAGLRFQVTL